jgi:hypothetical protein
MRQTLLCASPRLVPRADDEQPGVFALRPGVGLERNAGEPGDLREPGFEVLKHLLVAARLLDGANGCILPNSGHETGNISAAALSFIVQEPSGIIEAVSERSRDSSRLM